MRHCCFVAPLCAATCNSQPCLRRKLVMSSRQSAADGRQQNHTRRAIVQWAVSAAAAAVTIPFLPRGAVSAEEEKKVAKAKKPKFTKDNGILYLDIKTGTGATPVDGDFVIVDWVAYLSNGVIFDNTTSPGRNSVVFRMGQKKVIPGLEIALSSMKQGGVRKVIVPPDLAYGDRGVCIPDKGCLVPPGEALEYDITLKRVAISPI